MKKSTLIPNLFLAGAVILFAFQLYLINKDLDTYSRPVASAVKFHSPWKPEKKIYRRGELVTFTYNRTVDHNDTVIFFIDNLENQKTKEIYPGVNTVRLVEQIGTVTVTAVRQLPDKMNPGTYVLKGWASTEEQRKTLGNTYMSEPFEVTE